MGQATEPTDRVFSPKSKAVESDPQRLRANARRPMRDVGRLDGAQIAPLRDRARIQIDWLSARIGTVRAWVTSAVHNFTLPRKRTADTGKRGREDRVSVCINRTCRGDRNIVGPDPQSVSPTAHPECADDGAGRNRRESAPLVPTLEEWLRRAQEREGLRAPL